MYFFTFTFTLSGKYGSVYGSVPRQMSFDKGPSISKLPPTRVTTTSRPSAAGRLLVLSLCLVPLAGGAGLMYKERTSGKCTDDSGGGYITSLTACNAGATALGWDDTTADNDVFFFFGGTVNLSVATTNKTS